MYKHGIRKPLFEDSSLDTMANKIFD